MVRLLFFLKNALIPFKISLSHWFLLLFRVMIEKMEVVTVKRILVIVLILILVCSIYALVIGEPVDGKQLSYTITETGPDILLCIHSTDSAMALRGWNYRTKGDILYISVRKVPVSPLNTQGSNQVSLSTQDLREIYLGGKRVWTKTEVG